MQSHIPKPHNGISFRYFGTKKGPISVVLDVIIRLERISLVVQPPNCLTTDGVGISVRATVNEHLQEKITSTASTATIVEHVEE